jgi:hypothetical protein
LKELPPERCRVVSRAREIILQNLPDGYVEHMNWGMISHEIPVEVFSKTHNARPLNHIGLAAQNRCYVLYLMGAYQNPAQKARLCKAHAPYGTKLDLGKSRLRLGDLRDLPLDAIAELVASTAAEAFIARCHSMRDK